MYNTWDELGGPDGIKSEERRKFPTFLVTVMWAVLLSRTVPAKMACGLQKDDYNSSFLLLKCYARLLLQWPQSHRPFSLLEVFLILTNIPGFSVFSCFSQPFEFVDSCVLTMQTEGWIAQRDGILWWLKYLTFSHWGGFKMKEHKAWISMHCLSRSVLCIPWSFNMS